MTNSYRPTKNVNHLLAISLLGDQQKLSEIVKLGRIINARNRKERRGLSVKAHEEWVAYTIKKLGVIAHGIKDHVEIYKMEYFGGKK